MVGTYINITKEIMKISYIKKDNRFSSFVYVSTRYFVPINEFYSIKFY